MRLAFTASLDETGTDGRSPYTIIAGTVGSGPQCRALEERWGRRLSLADVDSFHYEEFTGRKKQFKGWTDFDAERFDDALSKIIRHSTYFDYAVAVENAAHAQIKRELHGTKGYKPDSHYGLGFRIARLHICQTINQHHPGSTLSFVVERGPWTGDVEAIYQSIVRTRNANRPAGYARMLAGLAAHPKGQLHLLEAADFLCGKAIADLAAGRQNSRQRRHFIMADAAFIRDQYLAGIRAEKDRRTAHHAGRARGTKS